MKNGIGMSCRLVRALTSLLTIGLIAPVGIGSAKQLAQQSTGDRKDSKDWVKLSPEGAPFTVFLPALPAEKGNDREIGISVHTYRLQTEASEYHVVWTANLPDEMLSMAPLTVLFPNALDEILKSAKEGRSNDLVTTRVEDIALKGNRGDQSSIESTSYKIEARGFRVGRDFISVAVMYPKKETASADAQRFLESLSLPDVSAVDRQGASAGGVGRRTEGQPTPEYTETDVDTRPIPLNRPLINYTGDAKSHNVQGVVRLRALVGADGFVKGIKLISHLPDGLDEEADEAARRFRFRPATKHGIAVAYWVTLEVEFKL